ncbi:MAG: serine/threonine protein phosphatase [Planctomycetes bacterium]|nr:serine/threonine protein phosphatase [Planctomycetota bacterium]
MSYSEYSSSNKDTGRIIAVGDIHGFLRPLELLLSIVSPTSKDTLVFLGDVVDRGPNAAGCINLLMELDKKFNCVFLMGNHEEMMLDSRKGPSFLGRWLNYGGDAVLRSYAKDGKEMRLENVPARHWKFISSFRNFYESEKHVFIHGMLDPRLPMEMQDGYDLRWRKFYPSGPHLSGKTFICGHTAQRDGLPVDLDYGICIDTCVYGGGWLTFFDASTDVFLQANAKGELRELARGETKYSLG